MGAELTARWQKAPARTVNRRAECHERWRPSALPLVLAEAVSRIKFAFGFCSRRCRRTVCKRFQKRKRRRGNGHHSFETISAVLFFHRHSRRAHSTALAAYQKLL